MGKLESNLKSSSQKLSQCHVSQEPAPGVQAMHINRCKSHRPGLRMPRMSRWARWLQAPQQSRPQQERAVLIVIPIKPCDAF